MYLTRGIFPIRFGNSSISLSFCFFGRGLLFRRVPGAVLVEEIRLSERRRLRPASVYLLLSTPLDIVLLSASTTVSCYLSPTACMITVSMWANETQLSAVNEFVENVGGKFECRHRERGCSVEDF